MSHFLIDVMKDAFETNLKAYMYEDILEINAVLKKKNVALPNKEL